MTEPLLDVRDLSVDYLTENGDVHVLHEVNFAVAQREFVGIVGESGCGKSTLLFAVAQLLSPPGEVVGGEVIFRGRDMVRLHGGELRHMRWRDYSMVMQSAMNALNPMKTISAQFKDTLEAHGTRSRERDPDPLAPRCWSWSASTPSTSKQLSAPIQRRDAPAGDDRDGAAVHPAAGHHGRADLGVGRRGPAIVDDEDRELQQQLGFAVLFVTHDMSVVSRYSDRVIVMYAGQIAESAPTEAIFERPLHPYSRGLMSAFPSVRGPRREMAGIPGSPPDLARPPSGCRFHPRCPDVMDICPVREPELYSRDGVQVRCLLYAESSPPATEPAQETRSS